MTRRIRTFAGAALATAVLAMAGCGDQEGDDAAVRDGTDPAVTATADTGAQASAPAPPPPPDLRLEVDLSARELTVYRNDEEVATHPVAVGTEEWPTRTGEWRIGQVVWNPRWIPPEEEWAQDEEEAEPGAPDNPLGRAQLVYDAPRSIHGTDQPELIGQAVSHGSLRVTNEVAMELARMVMEAGGAERDDAFYQRVRENRSERVDVPIPNPVPIRVHNGGGGGSGGS